MLLILIENMTDNSDKRIFSKLSQAKPQYRQSCSYFCGKWYQKSEFTEVASVLAEIFAFKIDSIFGIYKHIVASVSMLCSVEWQMKISYKYQLLSTASFMDRLSFAIALEE